MQEVSGRIDQLSQMITETGRTHALDRWPFLAELGRLVRPGDKPQERQLSSMAPFLYSSKAGDDLIALGSIHVADLMDSHMEHVVYSA